VGTNLNAREKLNAYGNGTFIDIKESANSFGWTVKKKTENAVIIINILKIIAIAYERDKKYVFITIINNIKNESPRMLLIQSLIILPKRIKGIKLKKIKNKGTILVNNKAEML
jgi:hypothetical protein